MRTTDIDADPVIGPVDAPDVHCMTLNLRRAVPHRADHPDAWERRRRAVATLVTTEAPHVLAVQEALPTQADALTAALGSRWEPVLVGRGRRGGGERVGLFVDTRRFRVADRRSWALSRRPLRPGSRSWGTAFPRLAVGVVLDDLVTGRPFLAVATHLDHLSPPARSGSARLLARIARDSALPTVLMGDLNAPSGSAPWQRLVDGGFDDTWERAADRVTAEVGTRPAYRTPRVGGRRIDGILTHPAGTTTAEVSRAAISTRTPGGVWPSDHAAVHAVLRWEIR